MANNTSSAVHGLWEATTNTVSATPRALIVTYRPRITETSAILPPTRLPTTMPRPNTMSANGTSARGIPATSVIVVLM